MKNILFLLLSFTLCSCTRSQIWNSGDLADWVKDQAVKQGCERESITLEEWYRKQDGSNVWHGHCIDASTGERHDFAIPVDAVWTPSSEQ